MITNIAVKRIQKTYLVLLPHLNEKARRLWAACQANDLGRGGISAVSNATGLARATIYMGLSELENPCSNNRVRKQGGGRKKITAKNPDILLKLEALVEPLTRGDPESSLRWTCKSTRNLANELTKNGYPITSPFNSGWYPLFMRLSQ